MDNELFRFGDFTLASGARSRFMIDCDAISLSEWHTLARLALPLLPPFKNVIGVPKGGIMWAEVFKHYVQSDSRITLVVDDVYTTGGSMACCVAMNSWDLWWGVVLFSRGETHPNITPLFQAHLGLGDYPIQNLGIIKSTKL